LAKLTRTGHGRALRSLILLFISALILSLALAAPVFGDHDGPLVNPTSPPGNENLTCGDVLGEGFNPEPDDSDGQAEEKFDPPSSGTQGHVTMTNLNDVISFEAEAGWLVAVAVVKGGNEGSNIYDYTGEPGGGVDHDNGLVTPTGQDVSHVSFCLVKAEEEETPTPTPATPTPTPATPTPTPATPTPTPATPTPTPEGSEAGETGTPTPTPSDPEGSVAGQTGTPAGSVPDTATSMPGFGGPVATLVFGTVLVASLGALAYANVTAARRRR
jgi:hypothetical protein